MTVLVFGTFDILHIGHIDLFKQAIKHGNTLVVVLARDKRVKQIKGSAPIHSEMERKEILEHIDIINKVYLGDESDVYKVIKDISPDVIALGYDQQVFTDKLEEKIIEFKLNTKIVRLEPYKHDIHKSGIIKEKILKTV